MQEFNVLFHKKIVFGWRSILQRTEMKKILVGSHRRVSPSWISSLFSLFFFSWAIEGKMGWVPWENKPIEVDWGWDVASIGEFRFDSGEFVPDCAKSCHLSDSIGEESWDLGFVSSADSWARLSSVNQSFLQDHAMFLPSVPIFPR